MFVTGNVLFLITITIIMGCQSGNQLYTSKYDKGCSVEFLELSRTHRIDKDVGIELINISNNIAIIKTVWDAKEYTAKEGEYFRKYIYLDKIIPETDSVRIVLEHEGIIVRHITNNPPDARQRSDR